LVCAQTAFDVNKDVIGAAVVQAVRREDVQQNAYKGKYFSLGFEEPLLDCLPLGIRPERF
jgi:hypothetical protein